MMRSAPFGPPDRPSLAAADRTTLAVLGVVVATLAVRLAGGADVGGALLLHAGLLAGFVLLTLVMARAGAAGWTPVARAAAVVAIMFSLYSTLGHVAFEAIPWSGDEVLERLDRALFFGVSPALWMAPRVTPDRLEVLSFVYAFFIPYLYMSIFLGLLGRPDRERALFITGFALVYSVSFLGYLFVPARGPVVELAAEFSAPLSGGSLHRLVVGMIDAAGGPHGAFPSLHLGASVFACAFDLRYNRLRGLIYLPMVVLIGVATVALRYHYVVDLVAGIILALLAFAAAHAWLGGRSAARGSVQQGEHE